MENTRIIFSLSYFLHFLRLEPVQVETFFSLNNLQNIHPCLLQKSKRDRKPGKRATKRARPSDLDDFIVDEDEENSGIFKEKFNPLFINFRLFLWEIATVVHSLVVQCNCVLLQYSIFLFFLNLVMLICLWFTDSEVLYFRRIRIFWQ